jgi:tRNA G18 (ribose-2'-O)-methylase SpoU
MFFFKQCMIGDTKLPNSPAMAGDAACTTATQDGNVDSNSTLECCHATVVAPMIPNVYLVITNISKRNNIRALLQTAAAFECTQVFVVGQKNFNFDAPEPIAVPALGNATTNEENHEDNAAAEEAAATKAQSSSYDLPKSLHASVAEGRWPIRRFDDWSDCVAYLTEHGIRLVGVEIDEDAQSMTQILEAATNAATSAPESSQSCCRGLAWCLGNEGTGLHAKQRQSCRAYCRIPQYGGGTASLNVYVAASIVLYQCHLFRRRQALLRSTPQQLAPENDAPRVVGEQRLLG